METMVEETDILDAAATKFLHAYDVEIASTQVHYLQSQKQCRIKHTEVPLIPRAFK